MRIITYEAWRVEAQIIKRMLGRVNIKVKLDVMSYSGYLQRIYIPLLDKPPLGEERRTKPCQPRGNMPV